MRLFIWTPASAGVTECRCFLDPALRPGNDQGAVSMADLSDLSASAFWRVLQPDADPVETNEWIEAFDAIVDHEGRERATFLLRKLLDRARARRVPLPAVLNTPYCNTIS